LAQRSQTVEGVGLDSAALNPHGGHLWYPPGVSENPAAVVPFGTGEAGIIGAIGNWANYNVWIDVPNTWLDTVLILRLQTGSIVKELDRKAVSAIEHMSVYPSTSGAGVVLRTGVDPADRIRGLLFANYGRPGYGSLSVSALKREVIVDEQPTSQRDGKFYIRMWGTEGSSAGDRMGSPIADRWAGRAQWVNFTAAVLPEDGGPISMPALSGLSATGEAQAVHLTDISLSVLDGGAAQSIELRQIEPVSGTIVSFGNFKVNPGGPININWSLPLTGRRGWTWQLLRTVPGIFAPLAATLNGYVA